MYGTSRARFRVVATFVAALMALAGCASAATDEDAAPPSPAPSSDAAAPTENASPSSETGAQLQTGELHDTLIDVMRWYVVPGASVAITTPEGTWSVHEGAANFRDEIPVESDMVWPLRSVTKSVVVTVLLQLVDEGELSLVDTIDAYVTGVPNGEEITLRQLADMSSGVGDYTHSQEFSDRLTQDPSQDFTLEELNHYGIAEGPQFEPGTDHVYSNTSTNLLGVVIEEVTGRSIGEAIDERIVEELGLTDTVYAESDEDWVSSEAQGYQGDEIQGEPIFNSFPSMGASGAMVSTTEDMSIWARALAQGSLISEELHEQRLEGAPLSEGPEYDEYGMGIGSLDGWWGHTGEGLGFSSLVMYDPETYTSIVIFMNISDVPDPSDPDSGTNVHVPTVLMREYAGILAGEGRTLTDPRPPRPESEPQSSESADTSAK